MNPPRLLILGGTGDAARLAAAVIERFGAGLDVMTSLAGRTREPRTPPGRVRSGGFGGVDGLAGYLAGEQIALLVDATHPFATQISANARAACGIAGVPRLILDRPAWTQMPGDDWIEVADIAAAARLPKPGQRVFLALGAGKLAAFADAGVAGVHFVVRSVDRPERPPLEGCTIIVGRAPFSEAAERNLLRRHRIDLLVSRNSGGDAAVGKIAAARSLGISVIMIRRPPGGPGERTTEIEEALRWITGRLAD
jgi:precorrin-6A/cobalt-precorrin-6A reductase